MANELPREVSQALHILGFVSLVFGLYSEIRNKR